MATASNPTASSAVIIKPNPWRSTVSRGSAATTDATSPAVSPPPLSGVVTEQIANASTDWSLPAGACLSEDALAETHLESSENSGCSGGNASGKKPAWNKPSNVAVEVTPVISAAAWPALSEITKASPKLSSSDSVKNLSEGSFPVSQGTGLAYAFSHMQVTDTNENPNSTPNRMVTTRLSSVTNGGVGGGNSSNSVSANDSFSKGPPPEGLVVEVAPNDAGKLGNSSAESSARENTHRDGGQKGNFGHYQHRNSFRRGNSGSHPRGNGSYHHNYGGRRDHDRGNQEWNPHRNFGGRDAHMQTQRGPSRPFIRGPPHANTPYIAPANPARPPTFSTPMMYPEVPSSVFYVPGPYLDPFRAVPMVTPMAPLYYPFADPHLLTKIVNQINYYFSDENLVKDLFLRRAMDEQGWVAIKLIADFKKVSELTDDIQLILFALQFSTVVEVEGEKVRRRDDWNKWMLPSSAQYSTVPNPQSLHNSSHDLLSARLQSYTGQAQ